MELRGFQDQTNLYNYKPSEFKKALDEAVLAESGVEDNCEAAEISCLDSSATESGQELVPTSRIQGSCVMDIRICDGCDSVLPVKSLKRRKAHNLKSFYANAAQRFLENCWAWASPNYRGSARIPLDKG